ncbi:hypothetical protein [Pontibacter flavimaris]|uniref:Uncharacterized protein n=1 Tax=Pontibacter flavimaris TaxID=1797110 RepID=A0A1Q5P8U4_9BACT|nr:hypothetical protein [Pontibacter flavimaris]OKL38656.1 hypothetical protein A3841_05810 [Pontibacter flavimaris]
MFSLVSAHESLDAGGNLKNETLAIQIQDNMVAFMNLVEAYKQYPCIKKALVEFMGEKPAKETEQVE